MNGKAFIERMRALGVFFFANGGRLLWYAPAPLAGDDLSQAQALKQEILALGADTTLEALCVQADPQEADYLRQERAGVLEFEAGLCRMEAELRAGLNTAQLEEP